MAGRGPAPKPASERVRRNVDPSPTIELGADDVLRGPDLPDDLWDPIRDEPLRWPSLTRRWWENWRRSAQAQTFTATDWDFLTETALLHRRFANGDASVAAELRLRVAKFGATPEDRARLRLAIAPPAPSLSSKPAADDEVSERRRARLAKAAGE